MGYEGKAYSARRDCCNPVPAMRTSQVVSPRDSISVPVLGGRVVRSWRKKVLVDGGGRKRRCL